MKINNKLLPNFCCEIVMDVTLLSIYLTFSSKHVAKDLLFQYLSLSKYLSHDLNINTLHMLFHIQPKFFFFFLLFFFFLFFF